MKTFEMLGISEEIRKAIEELGFEHPTPVQEEVIPYLLGEGNDVIALAQTGTGKTAAYGLPLIQKVNPQQKHTQALILSPTRELCLQISDSLSDFSKYIKGLTVVPVYGGTSIETQIKALKKGTQIIVATPGRLIDLIHRGVAKLENVTNVVLDEADEMLNMGFSESINEILECVPKDRNTLLFSATMSKEIERIARNYLTNHKEIVVGSRNEGAESVNHIYYMVNAKDKYLALKRIVDYYPSIFAIIFCRTKRETQEIADKLIHDGYNAEALHGDLSQQQRDLTMQKFRKHTTQFLVATDVAARGLDVDDLTHVINFGLPDDIESYTHRSGRTGRAGKKGTSISIIHTRERSKMHAIEKVISKAFVEGEIPDAKAICSKQLYKVMDQILKADVNEEEIAPFLAEINRHFEYVDKEDIIKKIVSMEFGKFLEYYANAPVIEKPSRGRGEDQGSKGSRRDGSGQRRGGERRAPRAVESGFKRLFINLGKADGFYPGEIMQFINKNVKGRQQVGHIDLLDKISYIEVPERDANKVMKALSGSIYKNREVRCNDAEEGSNGRKGRSTGGRNAGGDSDNRYEKRSRQRNSNGERRQGGRNSKGYYTERGEESGDWRQFFNDKKVNLRGEEPDFSEDGWARRKPRKK
ncbi:DEAD/DEAH box helicase [Hoylesella nanceiensis]|uniref:DEAD/DEAH box helicase n=1 Tax=Hoylesella nanceiensis TaxID=425941 RepID=UPI001CB249F6|nr:DEAD/DEAH box helicase [Hoylesella nanceiensis]MBF1428406.1 DEAD/DEAH box helicase [Hoylesella nanceiensis]